MRATKPDRSKARNTLARGASRVDSGSGREVEGLTPRLLKLIHILEWVRIEEYVPGWMGLGRPPKDRGGGVANAFVAKAVLGLTTTVALIERLTMDRALRRICGFSRWKRLSDEATLARAFAEFAENCLAERVHEALIKKHLGDQLIGLISRDGTAIEARERPAHKSETESPAEPAQAVLPEVSASAAPTEAVVPPKKRGRPRRGEVRPPRQSRIERQRGQTLARMIEEPPTACDRGTKCNAQGYKVSGNGHKLHLDTADCGVVVSALLTSASVHDSQTAIPLSRMTGRR